MLEAWQTLDVCLKNKEESSFYLAWSVERTGWHKHLLYSLQQNLYWPRQRKLDKFRSSLVYRDITSGEHSRASDIVFRKAPLASILFALDPNSR